MSRAAVEAFCVIKPGNIAQKCLRNSIEAIERHESGELILPPWVLEHHRERIADSISTDSMERAA